jgi:tetratricopeptide (TPR) repeat protein
MMKKLPDKKAFYVILLLYILAIVLYVAGKTFLGLSVGVLTALVALWKRLVSEKASQDQESLYLTQAKMMLKGGLGNVFVESMKDEIQQPQSAWPLDLGSRLDKAQTIEPDNQFAMAHNAVACALGVSVRTSRRWPVESDAIRYIRATCRKGRKLYPTEAMFCDAMGILSDSLGNHKIARAWFEKASKVDPPSQPVWRLRVATSYAMTGEHSDALKQLEQAKSDGLSNWLLDFNLGRTLCALGRYDEALKHLRVARRQRKLRSDIVMWMQTTQNAQMRLYRSAYYSLIFIGLSLLVEPKYGLWNLGVF